MKAKSFLSKTRHNVTPSMHKVRRLSLLATIESALNGGSLSVTGLGRNIQNNTQEKHGIKRVDRLCNNSNIHREISTIYQHMITLLVSPHSTPIILVDWSDTDERKQHFLLRASLATQGRSLTLYEEVHPLSRKEKPAVHRQFMEKLKRMLPGILYAHCGDRRRLSHSLVSISPITRLGSYWTSKKCDSLQEKA